MDKILKGLTSRISKLDTEIEKTEKQIEAIDKKIEEKEKEYKSLISKIASTSDAKEKNAQIAEHMNRIKAVQTEINVLRTTLFSAQKTAQEFEEIWGEGLTEEGWATKEENKNRVEKIRLLLSRSAVQLKKLEGYQVKKVKVEKEFNAPMNSEDNLKQLLEERDPELLKFLADQGINVTEKDIQQVIARILDKHTSGTLAKKGASQLKNQNVEMILIYGQKYITEHAQGNTI